MYGLFQTAFYFGYMALFSIILGIMCGTVGYIGANIFVRKIYNRIHVGMEIQSTIFSCSNGVEVDNTQVPKQLEDHNSTLMLDTLNSKPVLYVNFVKNGIQNDLLELTELVKNNFKNLIKRKQTNITYN